MRYNRIFFLLVFIPLVFSQEDGLVEPEISEDKSKEVFLKT